MIYAASVSTEKVEGLVELIADSLFQPLLNDEDIQLAKMGIDFEIQDINLRPDPEPLMTETIHAVSFIYFYKIFIIGYIFLILQTKKIIKAIRDQDFFY